MKKREAYESLFEATRSIVQAVRSHVSPRNCSLSHNSSALSFFKFVEPSSNREPGLNASRQLEISFKPGNDRAIGYATGISAMREKARRGHGSLRSLYSVLCVPLTTKQIAKTAHNDSPAVGEYDVTYPMKKPYAAFISPDKTSHGSCMNSTGGPADRSEEARRAYLRMQEKAQGTLRFSKQSGRQKKDQGACKAEYGCYGPLTALESQTERQKRDEAEFAQSMRKEHEIYADNEKRMRELEAQVKRCIMKLNYHSNMRDQQRRARMRPEAEEDSGPFGGGDAEEGA